MFVPVLLTTEMLIWGFLRRNHLDGGPEMGAERLVGAGSAPSPGSSELSGSEEEREPESVGIGPGHTARQGLLNRSPVQNFPWLTEAASFSGNAPEDLSTALSPENPDPGWQAGGSIRPLSSPCLPHPRSFRVIFTAGPAAGNRPEVLKFTQQRVPAARPSGGSVAACWSCQEVLD